MISLIYSKFPDKIAGYPIRTDFRAWLKFSDMIQDKSLSEAEKLRNVSELFQTAPILTETLFLQVVDFYLMKDGTEEKAEISEEKSQERPLFSFSADEKYLIADFLQYYQITLLHVAYLHWWEFLTLFQALPEESQCQKRIAYRAVDLSQIKDKAERKRIQKIQKAIALPYDMPDEIAGNAFWI